MLAHKREVVVVVVILCLGGFFRLYHAGAWMHFGNDEGRDAFVVADIVEQGYIKLLGPAAPNNRPDFHLGPAFYYLLAPAYLLAGCSPAGGAVTIAALSVAGLFVLYSLGRKLFGPASGIIALSLSSVSFLQVYYGRWAWNPNMAPFFILMCMYGLYQLTRIRLEPRNIRWLYIVALCLGIAVQLHGTVLIVLPVIVIAYLAVFRPPISWKKYLIAGAIAVLTNAPAIIYDLTHRFENLRGFFRVMMQSDSGTAVGFGERFHRAVVLMRDFWYESLLHQQFKPIVAILLVGIAVFVVWKIAQAIRRRTKDPALILCILWFAVPSCTYVLYKEAIPMHYFTILFPLPFLMFGWFITFIWRNRRGYGRVGAAILVIALWGLQVGYSTRLLRDLAPSGSRASSYPVTLSEMESVASFIAQDSQGQKFNFSSEPPGGYSRSYEYVFERAGIVGSVVSEPLGYIALTGRNAEVPERIPPGSIRSTHAIGNVRVIVVGQNIGNGD